MTVGGPGLRVRSGTPPTVTVTAANGDHRPAGRVGPVAAAPEAPAAPAPAAQPPGRAGDLRSEVASGFTDVLVSGGTQTHLALLWAEDCLFLKLVSTQDDPSMQLANMLPIVNVGNTTIISR